MGLQVRSPHPQIKTLQYAHSAATTAKLPVVINTRVLIPLDDAGANALNAYVYEAEISGAPKAASQAWALGAAIYWDDTAKVFTTTVGTNTLAGYALQTVAGGAGDTVSGLIAFKSF